MLWLWMTVVWAQEVILQADGEIFVGMPFVLTVMAKDFEEEPTPEVLDFTIPNSKVDFLGVSPSISTQMSYVNGRRSVSKDVRYAFRYRVIPSKTGTFQIPSVRVRQGTEEAESGNVQFEVREVAQSRDMGVELVLPNRNVRVGEVIPVYVDLYLRTNISEQSIMVPFFDLREYVSLAAPQNAVQQTIAITTAAGEIELPFERDQKQRNGRDFTRIRIRAEATMIKAGNLNLEPTRVVAQVSGGLKRDSFGFPSRAMRTVQALDKRRAFIIEPLPLTGQPKSFAGAVGESFAIDVRAQRTVVKVGDPIELDITIRGKGEMAGLKLPILYSAGLDKKHFDLPQESPIGEIKDDGSKLFRTSIRLLSDSVAEIPSLEFSYFDSNAGTYVTSTSRPIALSVQGSTVVSADGVVSAQKDARIGEDRGGKSSLSLTGANLKQNLGAYVEGWGLKDGLFYAAILYLTSIFSLLLVWGKNQTSDSRAAKGASRGRKKLIKELLKNAESINLKESGGPLRSAIKDFERHDEVDCTSILHELEKESFDPKANVNVISKDLASQIRTFLVWFLVILMGGLGPTTSFAQSPQELYNSAMLIEDSQERIEAFETAAKSYRLTCEQFPNSADVWVDFGNASLGARKYGDAMVGYLRALQLQPQNKRALQNRDWVEQKLPDWVQPQDKTTDLFFWSTWYNLPQLLVLGGVVFSLIIVIQILSPKRFRFAQIIIGLLWVSVVISSISVYLSPVQGVVMEEAGALRSTDNEGAPPVRDIWVPEGTPIVVYTQSDSWMEVGLPNGDKGWLPKRAVTIVQ